MNPADLASQKSELTSPCKLCAHSKHKASWKHRGRCTSRALRALTAHAYSGVFGRRAAVWATRPCGRSWQRHGPTGPRPNMRRRSRTCNTACFSMHTGCDLQTTGSVFGRIRAAGGSCVGDAGAAGDSHPSGWVEVMHKKDPFGDEHFGAWFLTAKGSGVWYNTGLSMSFGEHSNEAYWYFNANAEQFLRYSR